MTHDGLPVVLGVDGQTIGGYPKVAHVIRGPRPARPTPAGGAAVRFREVTPDEADAAARDRAAVLTSWLTRLRVADWGSATPPAGRYPRRDTSTSPRRASHGRVGFGAVLTAVAAGGVYVAATGAAPEPLRSVHAMPGRHRLHRRRGNDRARSGDGGGRPEHGAAPPKAEPGGLPFVSFDEPPLAKPKVADVDPDVQQTTFIAPIAEDGPDVIELGPAATDEAERRRADPAVRPGRPVLTDRVSLLRAPGRRRLAPEGVSMSEHTAGLIGVIAGGSLSRRRH